MKSLHEGLMDVDSLSTTIDKEIIGTWMKDNIQGKYKFIKLKDDTMKVWGNIVISKASTILPLRISKLEGNIYIEDCDIESLDGIFANGCQVMGDVNITSCPNLVSLKELPYFVDGMVSIMDCKNIKNLDGVRCLAGDVSFVKCGKRFKENVVKSAFPAAVNICCSEEDEFPNITEAFGDPTITRLYQQLVDKKYKVQIPRLFVLNSLSEIKPSMCRRFTSNDVVNNEKTCMKSLREVFGNSGFGGIVILENENKEFVYLYNQHKYRYDLLKPYSDGDARRENLGKMKDVIENIVGVCKHNYSTTGIIKNVYVYIYTSDLTYSATSKHNKRVDARNGMIDVRDKEAMRIYLKNQQNKYKKSVEQIKAVKNSDEYKKTADTVENLMVRFTKVIHKSIRDTKWAIQNDYAIGKVFRAFRESSAENKYAKTGVLSAFKNWSYEIARKIENSDDYTYDLSSSYTKTLEEAIIAADKALKEIGL